MAKNRFCIQTKARRNIKLQEGFYEIKYVDDCKQAVISGFGAGYTQFSPGGSEKCPPCLCHKLCTIGRKREPSPMRGWIIVFCFCHI